tara:strand:- start:285 stop:947 length:663 start_codon:yes stop_codon:yes gene_type:complete
MNHLFFKKSEAFVCGIFLGAAFFHLLPDATHLFQLTQRPYSHTATIFIMSSSLVLFAGFTQIGKTYQLNKRLFPWFIFGILTFHSIITGLALGFVHVTNMLYILFFAIVAHKAFDSFTLLIILKKYQFTFKRIFYLLTFFSLMTPLGILLGAFAFHSLNGIAANMLTAAFSAFAAGSFIYIATAEGPIIPWILHPKTLPISELIFLILGLSCMAILAFWV